MLIDLRSDTVTAPTPEMREAMANALVGDDVFEDDPTVNRLQEIAASMMGKEEGLFVPSGTMGNLVAILTHCGRGDEVILGNKAHTFLYEVGGISALGGIHSFQIPNSADGTMPLDQIQEAIRTENVHYPTTKLICLENTHNRCGGVALTVEYQKAVYQLAKQNGLQVHLDGARIFNAAIALGVKAIDLASSTDTVSFCLSKGLCAPVGSILCGDHKFITRSRKIRKQLGGGM
jgi:threonine aldolase